MIENGFPDTSRHRASPSLAVCQRRRFSFNRASRYPLPRRKHAVPDIEASNQSASRSRNPANAQSIFASSRRGPYTSIPKSP
jgi:hypothetical protein